MKRKTTYFIPNKRCKVAQKAYDEAIQKAYDAAVKMTSPETHIKPLKDLK